MSSKCASSSESRRRSAPYSATRSATSRSTRTGTCHGASPSRRCCVSLRRNPGALTAQNIRLFAPGRGDQSGERQLVGGQRQQLQLPPAPGSRGAKRARPYQVHVPDPYGVYLHDTPSRALFRRQVRAFSHGCIRIEKPIELATFLLRGDEGWGRARSSGRLRRARTGRSF